MSYCFFHGVIAGYDLTGYETKNFNDWRWSDEGVDFLNSPTNGISLYTDPEDREHLLLGFTIDNKDEDDCSVKGIDASRIQELQPAVDEVLQSLIDKDIISKDVPRRYQILSFGECF